MRFFFYDTETSGSNTRHDQILQFAAIEATQDLEITSELDIFCRPDAFVLPHPIALIVTGQKFSEILRRPMSHRDLIKQVYDAMAKPNTIYIGHNIFRFDEEIVRHEFYKALLDPYITSVASCGRMDTLPLLRACYAFRRDEFSWSMNEFGKPSFKLEVFAVNNGIDDHNAHDALGDVRVNIALARTICDRFPELWSNAVMMSSRSVAIDRMRDYRPFATVTRTNDARVIPVVPIARDPVATKDYIGFNLEHDPTTLSTTTIEELCRQYREERSESPLVAIRTNQCPITLDMSLVYDSEQIRAFNQKAIDMAGDSSLGRRARDAISAYKDGFDESPHIEDQLYGGSFFSDDDKALCREYHSAREEDKLSIVRQIRDKRLMKLGYRDLAMNFPHVFDEAYRTRAFESIKQRLTTRDDVPWLTFPRAMDALGEAREVYNDPHHLDILDDYEGTLIRVGQELGFDLTAPSSVTAVA